MSSPTLKDVITDYDQRSFIRMCHFLGESPAIIHGKLKKLIDTSAYSEATVKLFCGQFRKGELDIKDKRTGSHKEPDEKKDRNEQVKIAFLYSRHWSLRSLSSKTGIPRSTIQRYIRTDLKMKKKMGKWVSHELNETQLENRVIT